MSTTRNPWLALQNLVFAGANRVDGWASTLLNGGKDETFGVLLGQLSETDLENLFQNDALARRIVMASPWHALRFGFGLSIQGDEKGEQAAKILKRMAEHKALERITRSTVEGRLHGGSLLIMGTKDNNKGDLAKPLNESGIVKIGWLRVANCHRASPVVWNTDSESDAFGEPEIYRWQPRRGIVAQLVHASRVIRFPGAFTTAYTKDNSTKGGDWDDSVLLAAYPDLRALGAGMKTLPQMLLDASTVIHKTPGLMKLLAADEAEALQDKYSVAHRMRSVFGVSVVDATDSIEYANRNLSGVTDLIDRLMMGVAAAAEGTPVTVLFGRSPAGMNATGESDLQLQDGNVEAYRTQILEPLLRRLVQVFMLEKEGPTKGVEPDRWEITWPPLRPMTGEQKSQREKTHTERVVSLVNAGLIVPEEGALILGDPDNKEREINIDLELREELLESEKKAALKRAKEGPPEPPPPSPEGEPPEDDDEEEEAAEA